MITISTYYTLISKFHCQYAGTMFSVNFGECKQWRIQDFPDDKGYQPQRGEGGEHQPIIRPKFSDNCIKIKKIGLGSASLRPLNLLKFFSRYKCNFDTWLAVQHLQAQFIQYLSRRLEGNETIKTFKIPMSIRSAHSVFLSGWLVCWCCLSYAWLMSNVPFSV